MSHHDAGTGFVDTSNSHGAIGGAGMANVMAHSSRIWSLRVHNRQCRQLSLISLGEDARAQVWKVMSDTTKTNSAKCDLTFSPDQVLSHHVGKNIWAGAIYEGDQVLLVTGGADGRLAMTNIRQHNTKYLWTSKNNAVSLGVASNAPSGLTISDAALGVHTEAKVNERTSRSTQLRSGNTFKSYCWLGEKTVLATTSAGNVLLGALQPKKVYTDYKHDITEHSSLLNLHVSWTGLDSLDALSSFPIIAAVPSQFALLTGAWGDVFIYLQAAGIVKPFVKLPRKVVFLAALEIVSKKDEHHSLQRKTFGAVIACQGIQFAYFVGFGIILEDIAKVQDALRQVNLPVGFLVTSVASLAANLLALGSRSGALALYDITHVQDTSVLEPASVCRQLHSESITSIHALPYDHSIYVSTTGRDSCFAVHEVSLDKSSITVQTIHRTLLPFGPCIEGAWLSPTGELLVWGFRGQELVIWNYTDRQEVMVVGCGGFRRTWSFFPHRSTAGGGSLIWTQASLCHVFYQQGASHILLQPGSHGREIKALAVRPSVGDGLGCIVATGAEDTTIRISRHCEGDANVSEQPFDTLGILRNHSTGIQKLVWSPDGTYLFSAAGKEEFYIWRVQALPYIEIGTLNVACCPQVSDDGDLRIMDLDVLEEKGADSFQKSYLIAMGYSNSSMRIWRFQPDSSTQKMQLLGTGVYSTVCLTQCHFVWFGLEPFILTCATDGRIALWRIGEVILRNNSAAADREAPSPSAGNLTSRLSEASPLASSQPVFHPLTSAAVHQSSIKSLAFARLSPTSTLIVTGGDDNALGFSLVSMLRDSRGSGMFAKFAALLVPKAHASAINALSLAEISAELGSSEPNSKSSFEEQASTGGLCSFRLVSASNDQRLITWDVRVELSAARSSSATGSVHSDFLGTELIHVFRNTSGRSLVADVDCMDTIQAPYQHPKGHKVILAGVGLEIWDIATNTREKYDAT
ncbi:MAG: hypothetical protein LQ340_000583 [Diploschistes diacapsis]|nr:MAG: hypothetical protein LQ340_000583 [Diploschistes diacapsis]